uniref:Phosphoinositide-3-kinase interacting protein 1 n=1 Tax=Anas platyrhynchos platyrhynchos TaxID=8840 RepID=A0A493U0K8_ANAPP
PTGKQVKTASVVYMLILECSGKGKELWAMIHSRQVGARGLRFVMYFFFFSLWGEGSGRRGPRADGPVPPAAAEDHNSCRNPDGSAAPWCYVRGADGVPERRPCDIAPCPDATATTVPVPTAEVNISQEVNQVFEPADTLPSRSEAAAVQPVIGISQRVQMNSREKKDLGTLGTNTGLINKYQ